MGCILSSTLIFQIDETIPGQDKSAQEVFDELELPSDDINKLFTIFSLIDKDKSGAVSADEIFKEINLRGSKLDFKIFEFFDEGKLVVVVVVMIYSSITAMSPP